MSHDSVFGWISSTSWTIETPRPAGRTSVRESRITSIPSASVQRGFIDRRVLHGPRAIPEASGDAFLTSGVDERGTVDGRHPGDVVGKALIHDGIPTLDEGREVA